MRSVKRIAALTGRNIKEIVRDPLSIVFMIGLPVLMEILFYFLFHNATSQFEMIYLAPGMLIFGQSFITLFTAMLIAADRGTSFMVRLYTTEIKSYEFLVSYALAAIPMAFSQGVVLLTAAVIIDPSFFGAGLFAALFLGIVSSLLFVSLGILIGSVCNEKAVGGVSAGVITGQSVLSGMWFPVKGLSSGFIKVMDVLPFRNATRAVQSVAGGYAGVDETLIPCLILLAYTAAVFALAVWVFRKKMKQ
ncbi:MAG: ABC transporter permease [Clostridia bacterium]|nr:ABC transporter permease [Clostridia bacterium]